MLKLPVVASIAGGLILAVGVGLVFLPAGVVVFGVELLVAGLHMDDGA